MMKSAARSVSSLRWASFFVQAVVSCGARDGLHRDLVLCTGERLAGSRSRFGPIAVSDGPACKPCGLVFNADHHCPVTPDGQAQENARNAAEHPDASATGYRPCPLSAGARIGADANVGGCRSGPVREFGCFPSGTRGFVAERDCSRHQDRGDGGALMAVR